ncbi:MAG TPA: hypothetical protein PKJ41_16735 [Bryobacteraceae bacterium]|nr:hypothetical protein [Bryobacteraceae bacterium]HPT25053.1 hypothetical protein [Bryobacteraceae bacterium]
MRRNRKRSQGGNAILESTLCFIFLVPLMVGSVGIGMSLNRAIQANQVTRSAGHMYARGLNFAITGNKQLLVRMATGLNLQLTGGDGVVYLTRAVKIGDQQCLDGGVTLAQCSNRGQTVITSRIAFGNLTLRNSSYGNPASTYFNSSGDAAAVDYLKQAALVISNFNTTLVLGDGENAYVSETYFASAGTGFGVGKGAYNRSIF